jgi:hypothetical protein
MTACGGNMEVNSAIVALGIFAVYLAVTAVLIFVRTLRKPPSVKGIDEDFFLGSDPDR